MSAEHPPRGRIVSSHERAAGIEPIRPDIHLYANESSPVMMPDRDLSRASSDALILDGSARQALVATRTLGRLGLRIVGAESADLCDPRFGVPTFASRWSAGTTSFLAITTMPPP